MIPDDMKEVIAYGCKVEVPHQAMRLSTCVVVAEMKHMRTWVSRSTGRPNYSVVPIATACSMEVGIAGTCQSGSAMTTGSSLSADNVDSADPPSSGREATPV